MGCDIHAQIEYKPWPDYQGHWEFAEIGYLPRNYSVFAAMADVRNGYGIEPVSEARGLPEDVDGDILERSKSRDWHSHSWLTADEFEEALTRASKQWEVPKEYRAALATMRELGSTARIVFWFDN